MIKNIFVTGLPGCGKTTLIKEILKELKIPAKGFFTEEIRREGERIGFKIVTLSGKEGILAEKGFKSSYKVSKYGVILRDLEEIGVKEIEEGLKEDKIIIIDEIGKAEMFSEKFKEAVLAALNSQKKVLGTIKLTYDPFTDKIKKRNDTKVFYLTRENREKLKEEILCLFQSLQKKK
jgi:nucleoside-triphosphatase